jgi:hypothetical protein
MSDGDSPWLDETGAQTSERSRDHAVAPGQSLLLELRGEIALTVLPEGAGGPSEFFKPLLRVFCGGESNARDERAQAAAIDFSLATENVTRAVDVRVFASAAFPFSPLREFSLAPGECAQLSTGEKGISLRVA